MLRKCGSSGSSGLEVFHTFKCSSKDGQSICDITPLSGHVTDIILYFVTK